MADNYTQATGSPEFPAEVLTGCKAPPAFGRSRSGKVRAPERAGRFPDAPPRLPEGLTRAELLDIVRDLQLRFFAVYDEDDEHVGWDLDKDIDGADAIEFVTGTLAMYGLTPEEGK